MVERKQDLKVCLTEGEYTIPCAHVNSALFTLNFLQVLFTGEPPAVSLEAACWAKANAFTSMEGPSQALAPCKLWEEDLPILPETEPHPVWVSVSWRVLMFSCWKQQTYGP